MTTDHCWKRLRKAGWVLLAWAVVCVPPLTAKEPFQAFLDGLRERQMFDMALEYLKQARTNPLVADEFKSSLVYEEGRTLVDSARYERDVRRRLAQLDAAQEKFTQFIAANPEHALVAAAECQLGNVLVERGRAQLDRARQTTQPDDANQQTAEARALLTQAQQVFGEAESKYRKKVDAFEKYIDSSEQEKIAARRQARLDLIQARLMSAQVMYELSQSFGAADAERKKLLESSAEKYRGIYEDYRRLLAGLYARMWQGRCLQEMGNTQQALAYYSELLSQPDEQPEFRTLKAKTLRLAMLCWTTDQENKLDEAIRRGNEWLTQARGSESLSPEGLAIRWLTAKAIEKRAKALPENDPQRKPALSAVLEHAAIIAKNPGDHQQEAKQLVAQMRNTAPRSGPTSFAEGRDQAREAVTRLEAALEKSTAGASQDATQQAELRNEVQAAGREAFDALRLALTLKNDETLPDDVQSLRYLLCYVCIQTGRYYDAAVIGEFVARRYPQSSVARLCAGLAVVAWQQAYNAAPPTQRAIETARLVDLAGYITKQWPNDPESDRAWITLGNLAQRSNDLPKAIEYFSKVRADSPLKAEADCGAGFAQWTLYLSAFQQPDAERPAAEELDKQLQEARTLLEQGVRKQLESESEPNYAVMTAELSLAQLYIAQSQYELALSILEHPKYGPLTLVKAKSAVTERGNFPIETFKAALQAYVGLEALDKAEAIMQALDARAAEKGEGTAALGKIYYTLGRELEARVSRLRDAGKHEELSRVIKSFELFLENVARSESGNTFSSLSWVAETYVSLGGGLTSGAPDAKSREYLQKAANTYQQLLDRIAKDPAFVPQADEAAAHTKLRLARCQRLLGNYSEAIELLVGLLKVRPATLDVQSEAAATYQAWGAQEPKYYLSAVQGDRLARRSDGSTVNIVWGWRKLAAMVHDKPKFRSNYYEACFHVAECAYLQALGSTGDDRTKGLQTARSMIEQLARTDPELGDPHWFAEFDRLLKDVQRQMGAKVTGLKELQKGATQAAGGR